MDSEALLLKINSGKKLKPGEIEEVAALLEWIREDLSVADKISLDDVYSLLLVIGRARSGAHQHLLEQYLDCRDPLTVALVLEILCVDWELTREYLERVVSLAFGAPWDPDEDVRHAALKILGEYLHKAFGGKSPLKHSDLHQRDLEVLQLLVQIFQDEDAPLWTRQIAYIALCRAFGKPWEQVPSECHAMDFCEGSESVDWEMVRGLNDFIAGLPR